MPAVTALRPAVADALAQLADQMTDKVLTCEQHLPADEVRVPLHDEAFRQILGHLLGNAMKHTPAGTTITLTVAVQGDRVVLSIADQGPGIPPHRMTTIGDGHRADPGLPGQGQGLRLTRALLLPAGGRLSWRNGKVGAVFEVLLPLSP